jgi:branched-chain amino acid transport system ATP-binding protein
MAGTRFLEVKGLHAWYGESHVLHGVDFHVDEGEVVTLLGRTAPAAPAPCARSSGLTGCAQGCVQGARTGPSASGHAPHLRRLSIGYSPEERGHLLHACRPNENLLLSRTDAGPAGHGR